MTKYFKDLEGKIPAKEGDRVALVRHSTDKSLDLIQADPNRRPIMRSGNPTFEPEYDPFSVKYVKIYPEAHDEKTRKKHIAELEAKIKGGENGTKTAQVTDHKQDGPDGPQGESYVNRR